MKYESQCGSWLWEKSAGPDDILNEFIVKGEHILTPYLQHLFNFIFNSGKFPEIWSEGYIIPIHKKGDTDNPDNYRGITLLSCLGKLFTRILNKRLNDWAELNSLYVEAQAGFRSGMGTVDNIFVLHALLTKFLNSGKKLYCAFIDFSKAFDYIVRENLWYKLIKFGVSGKMYAVINSMYENAKSMVRHNCSLSESFACRTGVRQGESLSPFLFSIYLNDLENTLANGGVDGVQVDMFKLFLILYADDIVLLSETAEDLQHSLNMLHTYCDAWKLSLNTSKSKVVVFRKGGRLPLLLNFKYNDTELEIVQSFTYLGVVFSSTGSFSQLQETLASQAQKALFKLEKCIQPFTGLTPSFICELFDKLVAPVLSYASEVWGFIRAPAIERVHLKFMKKLLHIKQSTQNDFVYGELGRVPLSVKRQFRIVKYWLKVVSSKDCKYIKILYKDMLNEIDGNRHFVNWAGLVRNLLESSGFAHVWFFQGVGDTNRFLNVFKSRLNDIFIQTWRQRLNDSSRARFYVQFTDTFKYHKYLDVCILKFRTPLCRLRTSAHRLMVECGRWTRPPTDIQDRKCPFCNILEDEYHLVIECQQYADLRVQYIPTYYTRRPSMFKLIQLLSSEKPNVIKRVSAFVYHAFDKRNQAIFQNPD